MSRNLKLAFIHIMRTGGSHAISQLNLAGYKLIDSWRHPYKWGRDWTKEEALEIASEKHEEKVLFHNHLASWDLETIKAFKENGWTTFTIIRDPREQLCSLYHFQIKGVIYQAEPKEFPSLDDFINLQISKEESCYVDHSHWGLPSWWKSIDVIMPYEEEINPVLSVNFGISFEEKTTRVRSNKRLLYDEYVSSGEISKETNKDLTDDIFYKRYLNAISKNTNKLVVLITSCDKNSEERESIRDTWVKDLDCPYYFVIGRSDKPSEIEGDILYVECGDNYEDCPIKQYLSIEYIRENFDFDNLFCCDDDTYVIVKRILDSGFEKHDYYGGGPIFEHGDPHYVQGGAGVFLSKHAVDEILKYPKDGEHLKCRWSDQMLGKILDDCGIHPVFNKRFQMGHEEQLRLISRDYTRIATSHKLKPIDIRQSDIDVNPFHVFEKIYWISNNVDLQKRMEEQLEDADIFHLITKIKGDYKTAVKDAQIKSLKKILIIDDNDVFVFKFRDISRFFFNEVKDWKIMTLGAEAQRVHINSENSFRSNEVKKFSCLGLHEDVFEGFLQHETIEDWMQGKDVLYPKRISSSKFGEAYKGPEVVPDIELDRPIKCAMIVNNYKRGGAEIEFNEMLIRLDPKKVQWVGLASGNAFQFEVHPDYKDKFPPMYAYENHADKAIDLKDVNLCKTFEEAVLRATQGADIIIKWHVNHPIVEAMPQPSILLSNAFGRWVLNEYRHIRSNMCVGNSDHSGRLFWGGRRSRTIYSGHAFERLQLNHGRDKQREIWGFGPKDKLVGYTGRVDINKNLDTVIKAVSLLSDEHKLVFVGQPVLGSFEEIEIILEKYLPGRYVVDDWCHHVGDALSALDCFVLIGEYEGFSNSLAEAWMMEIPTVFSRCGSVMELEDKYGQIGMCVNIGVKPIRLANKIKEAMFEENKHIVEKIGKVIREEFTIEKSARDWEEAIQDLYKQFQLPNKLKACLLLPNIDFGGTEVWSSMLLKCSQPSLIEWHFAKPKSEEIKTNEDVLIDLLPYAKFHIEEDLSIEHENLEIVSNKMQLIQRISQCDVVVTWGVKDLADWFPETFDKPIVMLSKNDVGEEYHAEILRNNCHIANHFSAPSSSSQNLFPKIIQNSVDVIPNGFVPNHVFSNKSKEQQKIEWGLNPDDIVIGYIGRWSGEKNPLALGKAISALPEEFKGVYVGVVRDGPWSCEEQHYKDDMNKFMTPEDQDRRLKYVPVQRQIGDALNGMDVFFLPSIQEGFGHVLIEAWAAGVPVVSTNVGVFKDMWGMFGFPFGQIINPHDDGNAMRDAIKEALKMTPDQLLEIKGHALYRFNGPTIAHRWFNYLNGICHRYKENSVKMDIKQKIHMLLREMSPKKIARQFNRDQVSPPEGHEEWTYSNLLEFIAL